ncbi:response regulator transcription factor [Paenibacillus sp. L3-i20]|uniref:response regulator transcription factor n=1 Tax=Paenibacillus sp. L3-i20 TaxID=2905833 RepID=UPI001EE15195|nr:LuxR C-terminal-related transcriptional regulator [Paenibacillus sp. L3-i20]GKU76666.1 hypothetical protein L3i20_v210630 [Paenibacillus sp. L3-i20]
MMKGYIHTITIKMQGSIVEGGNNKLYNDLNHFIEQHVKQQLSPHPAQLSIEYDYQINDKSIPWLEHPLLTERQCKIVQLLIEHYSVKRIASHMFISENTVKKHIQNIKKCLNISSSGSEFVFEMLREIEKVNQAPTLSR